MRDDFSKQTKEILAKRVGYKCSNPKCKKVTIGPHSLIEKTINIGVAAHIFAASKGGPRFSESMTPQERKSISNGIWLCQNCAKLIDTDTIKFSSQDLTAWKLEAESDSLAVILNNHKNSSKSISLCIDRIKVNEKLYYEVSEANKLIQELLISKQLSNDEKQEIGYYIGLQVAKFTDDNGFYIQDEIAMQCVGTFLIAGDIFTSNLKKHKETLQNYTQNIRATLKLLKTVDTNGMIDTSKKTPLMMYYTEHESKESKNDFLS